MSSVNLSDWFANLSHDSEAEMAKPTTKRPIIFDTLNISVLGPRALDKNLVTIGCVTDFLRTVEHNTRHLLKQHIKVSPELKGFRVRFR